MPECVVKTVRLYYEIHGVGFPLVCIHGHTLTADMWEQQLPALCRQRQVIIYDLRGHGRSAAPPTGYTYGDHADDLLGLVDALGLDQVDVCGFSQGGGIALQAAITHPQRIRSLILISSMLDGYPHSPAFVEFFRQFGAMLRTQGVEAAVDGLWLSHPFFAGLSPENRERLRHMALAFSGAPYRDTTPHPRSSWRQIQRLGEIRHPTLVVVGQRDLPDLQGIAQTLVSSILGAELVCVANAGHMVTWEAPDVVNAALVDFLGRSTARSTTTRP